MDQNSHLLSASDGIRVLLDGTRVAVERTPVDAALRALAELDDALRDARLREVLGDRFSEVQKQILTERTRVVAVIEEFRTQAEMQLRTRRN